MKKKNRKKKNSVECAVHWNGGIKFCLHSAMWQQRRRGRRRRRKALIASYINIISRFGIQRHEELSQNREDLCGRAGARGVERIFCKNSKKNKICEKWKIERNKIGKQQFRQRVLGNRAN